MGSSGKTLALALLASAALVLGACSTTATPSPRPMPPATTATGTTSPSTPAAAGPSDTSQATASGIPGGEPTVMATSASVTLFFIAVGDAGISGPAVGCGDSAVAVTSQTITYTDPVEGALRTLLANHAPEIGQSGLRNSLSDSRLSVASVDRSGTTITAHLRGTLSLAGECDIPRVEQQLLHTAQQAAGASVALTINGKPLAAALGLK